MRLEVVDQAVVAAVQKKQHGAPDDVRAARGALLEDVVVSMLHDLKGSEHLESSTHRQSSPVLRADRPGPDHVKVPWRKQRVVPPPGPGRRCGGSSRGTLARPRSSRTTTATSASKSSGKKMGPAELSL